MRFAQPRRRGCIRWHCWERMAAILLVALIENGSFPAKARLASRRHISSSPTLSVTTLILRSPLKRRKGSHRHRAWWLETEQRGENVMPMLQHFEIQGTNLVTEVFIETGTYRG